jgi:hypothetical protein
LVCSHAVTLQRKFQLQVSSLESRGFEIFSGLVACQLPVRLGRNMATRRALRIGLLPGDGIGKEVIPVSLRNLCSSQCRLVFVPIVPVDELMHRPAAASSKP